MLTKLARSVTPRAAGVFLLFAALAAVLASSQLQPAHAAAPSPPKRTTGGFVPPIGHASPSVKGSGDLINHGGPVMLTNTTYTIFWIPSGQTVSANYVSTINQYFQDVAHDSGLSTNVYASDTQYSGILYSSTVGGTYTDTAAFPANGCTPYGVGAKTCLTDAQLQAEINKVISLKVWVKNGTSQFFIFTPKEVESCDPGNGCTFTSYCAYHGVTSSGAIYANMPYATSSIYPGSCDNGQYPNSDDADATINVTSHEQTRRSPTRSSAPGGTASASRTATSVRGSSARSWARTTTRRSTATTTTCRRSTRTTGTRACRPTTSRRPDRRRSARSRRRAAPSGRPSISPAPTSRTQPR